MKKTLPLFLLYFSLFSFWGNGQEIKYYQPFDTISSKSYFRLACNINNKQLVLKLSDTLPKLFIFNDSGSLISQLYLPIGELDSNVVPEILVDQDCWTLVFQHNDGNNINLAIARLNEFGGLLQKYTRLETSNIDKLGQGAYYNYSVSTDRKKIILYRILEGLQQEKILADYIALNSHGEILERGSHYISYRQESQAITPLFQHSNGKTYFAIYDKPNDYKLSSKISIYLLTASAKDLLVKEIDFKSTKPVQPVFASNTLSHELIFASLYYDHYSPALKGVLITYIDLNESSVNALTKTISFIKSKGGEFSFKNSRLNLKYRQNSGDVLNIGSCAVLGKSRDLTILFDNQYSVSRNNRHPFSNNPSQNTTLLGTDPSNLRPGLVDYDMLRNYVGVIVSPTQTGSGNTTIKAPRIASVSTNELFGGANSQTFSERYASPTAIINQDRIQIQFDKNDAPVRKQKLSFSYNYEQLPVLSGNITSTDEFAILSYSSNNNDNFILQLFDDVNPAYQALLINKNEYKPFYGDTFSFAGKKKIFIFFTTADDKKIGVALISW